MIPVEDLLDQASAIKNETVENNNSASRVGAWMEEVIPHLQEIANKADSGGSTNTLKAVEGEIVQLAGNLNQKTSWPIAQTSECLLPAFPFDIARRFLVDLYLEGPRDAEKYYCVPIIRRNQAGVGWEIRICKEIPVESGTPTLTILAIFSTTVSPENGDNITIHTLSPYQSSGISGRVAVRWSAIPSGTVIATNYASSTSKCRLDDEIFNKEKSNYIRPIERLTSANDYTDTEAAKKLAISDFIRIFSDGENIAYKHPGGDGEYTGDSSYTQNMVGVYQRVAELTYFNVIYFKGAISAPGDVVIRVYKTSSMSLAGKLPDTDFTFVEEFTQQDWDSDATKTRAIRLTSQLSLDTNESVVVLFSTKTATDVIIRKWSVNPDNDLLPILYSNSTDYANIFNVALFVGSLPTFAGLPLLLTTEPPFVKQENIPDMTLLSQRVDIIEDLPEVVLSDNINAVVDDKLQLFFRGIVKAKNPYNYDIVVTCVKGAQYSRYFEYTPVLADVGSTTFKIDVKNSKGDVLATKTVNMITKFVVQSPATLKKILFVGDSLTSEGTWIIETMRRLTGTGGTPAGLILNNLQAVGRKTDGNGVGWEGTGGWTWYNYTVAGATAYRFQVSGIITPPARGALYSNNSIQFMIDEINITEGSGNIRCTVYSSGSPTASGLLTKLSGTGDASISFSSVASEPGNPFWNAGTGALDFPAYVNTYCGGSIDEVCFLLTWNGISANQTDFSSMITTAKTLIDHIHTSYPLCLIKIMGMQLPSLNGGMGANYGATGTGYADTFGMVKTILNMNKAYQDWCNEAAYSSFCEFVNVSSQFDSENNMQEADTPVNSRSAKTEKRGTNGVHPATEGYYQIADVMFRNIVATWCQ